MPDRQRDRGNHVADTGTAPADAKRFDAAEAAVHGRARRSWAAAPIGQPPSGRLRLLLHGLPQAVARRRLSAKTQPQPAKSTQVLETTPQAGGASVLADAHRIEKLTIGLGGAEFVATALIDTGSRIAEVIFEEFKGTGNLCEGPARG